MARSRNIKPGFFTNDLLAEIDPLGRLLFAGLWTVADREGRLQDRPKKIKAEVLPFDNCDTDTLLEELHKHGFILRYSVDGVRYIQVIAWKKHQNPHIKEAGSTLPAPVNNHAGLVQAPEKEQPKPEPAGLIPDSLNLIPDSLIPSTTSPEKPVRFDARAHLSQLGVDQVVVDDWIALRSGKKAKVTKTAINGIENEAAKAGISLPDALRKCCERGWSSFEAEWLNNGSKRQSPKSEDCSTRDYGQGGLLT